MKFKYLAIAAALGFCAFTTNAQQNEQLGNDIWIGVNGGMISTYTNKMNKPQPYLSIELGKWFTPVWGGRVALGGFSQYYGENDKTWSTQGLKKWDETKNFVELNVDGILNLSQALSKKSLPLCDFYLFMGPTMNLASKCTEFSGEATADGTYVVKEASGTKARFGMTAGLGLSFNVSKKSAIGVEYRTGVTPSIFGDASVSRKAENTNRFSIRYAYTFGGRLGKDGYSRKHGRVETITNTVEVPVEKIVTKEVVKEVMKDGSVVTKYVPTANFVFFQIGRSSIDNRDKIRLQAVAKIIKEGPKDMVYKVSGYADKHTGSAKTNQKLSEKRAKAVYDYLVQEGVNPDQLKMEANAGVDNMFFNDACLSRVVIVSE